MQNDPNRSSASAFNIVIRKIRPLRGSFIEDLPQPLLHIWRQIERVLHDSATTFTAELEVLFRRDGEHTHLELAQEESQDLLLHRFALVGEAVVEVEGGAFKADAGMAGAGVEFVTGAHDEQRGRDEVGIGAVDAVVEAGVGDGGGGALRGDIRFIRRSARGKGEKNA